MKHGTLTLQCADNMLSKYIFLETGRHPLQDAFNIILIVLDMHVQRKLEMDGCLDTGSNFKQINAFKSIETGWRHLRS